MNCQRGQLLAELLIAMAILVMVFSVIVAFVLGVYLTDRMSREITIATFLAKEGIEATKSIRDDNWDNLINGQHGLAILNSSWIFHGNEDDVSNYLKEGRRKIIVEEIDINKKKVTSIISWKMSNNRPKNIVLVTYFTNWRKSSPYVIQLRYRWRADTGGSN